MSNKIIALSLDGTMDSLVTTPTHIAEMQDLFDGNAKTVLVEQHETQGWQVKYYYDTMNELHDKKPSLVSYYDEGLGAPHVDEHGNFIKWSKQPAKFAEKLDDTFQEFGSAVFAEGINAKVAHAYHFLATHYQSGDKVYCFGFSRGSYEAILLAQMIRNIGLVDIHSKAFENRYHGDLNKAIIEGFKCYKRHVHPDQNREAQAFKNNFCHDGKELIHFMGLFEPVKGLVPRTEPDDHHLGNVVKHFRQALAIDEHRIEYPPIKVGTNEETSMLSCWFSGAHGDLGGGYKKRQALSNIPLHWMLDEASKCGLPIDEQRMMGDYPENSLAEHHNSLADNIPFTGGTFQWKEISNYYERPICVSIRGETIHPSALFRYGHTVPTQDMNRIWVNKPYTPNNLAKAVQLLNHPAPHNNAERSVLMFNTQHGYRVPSKLPMSETDIQRANDDAAKVQRLIAGRKLTS